MLAVAGVTATEATGTGAAATVTAALPLWPSLVAVIVAEPAVTPVTRPLALTVATALLPLAHVTWLDSGLPLVSMTVAPSWTVWPCGMVGDGGVTVTDPTGTVQTTLTLAVSDLPPGWAVAATPKAPKPPAFQWL